MPVRDQQLGRHGLPRAPRGSASASSRRPARISVSIHSGSQRTRPWPIGDIAWTIAVVGVGVLEPALVEGEVAEPDRAHRPPFRLRHVAQQGGRPLARLPVADRRRAQRQHAGGERRQLRRLVALGQGDRLRAGGHRRRERAAVLDDADRAEHADQRAHRAPRPQVGVEVGEQRVGRLGAAQEAERRGEHLGQEHGVGRRPVRSRSSRCTGRAAPRRRASRWRSAGRRPSRRSAGPARRRRARAAATASSDRAGHVGEGAVADVGGEGVEEQVDGDGRRRRRRPRWPPCARLLVGSPLPPLDGGRRQRSCWRRIRSIRSSASGARRRRRRPGRAAARPRRPCRRRGWPRRRGAAGAPGRSARATAGWPAPTSGPPLVGAPRWAVIAAAVVERPGDGLVRADGGPGEVPGPRRASRPAACRRAPGGRRAGRPAGRRGRRPSASAGGGTSGDRRRA